MDALLPSHPSSRAVHAQEQVRRGPTSVSDFEVSLADIYTGASIDVRVLFPSPASHRLSTCPTLPLPSPQKRC